MSVLHFGLRRFPPRMLPIVNIIDPASSQRCPPSFNLHGIAQNGSERFATRNIGLSHAKNPAARADDTTRDFVDYSVVPGVRRLGEGDGAVRLIDPAGDALADINQ